jgi:hypothetical protein
MLPHSLLHRRRRLLQGQLETKMRLTATKVRVLGQNLWYQQLQARLSRV